ncbi:MAG: MqnA/MqnD/SBP family protein, partial [Planctomycetota bacterium]
FRKPGDGPVKTVALDVGSETSVALLKILLNREMDLSGIRFRRIEPTTRLDELQDDLVLLIGNAGLTADPGGRQVTDLGEAWHQWTGLPFVFALWLIAPDVDPDEVVPHLLAAHRRATQDGDSTSKPRSWLWRTPRSSRSSSQMRIPSETHEATQS